MSERIEDGGFFVRNGYNMERLDDGGEVIGQIDREVTLAVCELYMHCLTVMKKQGGGKAWVFERVRSR